MAVEKCKIKTGMKGSSGGRNRWAKTAILKSASKTLRREQDKQSIKEQDENENDKSK